MREVTGLEPAMWGPSSVGFGQYINGTSFQPKPVTLTAGGA